MVATALRDAKVPQADVSILVQEVGARRPSLALNPNTSRNPASVMKVVTTYAALELLGPAFRWRTEVYRDGDDLVLRGSGDPKLNHESFWMLLRNVRARGVREIRGDVVLDRSYFGPVSHELTDGETFRPYNVAPDALLVNFKTLRFVFWPEDTGQSPRSCQSRSTRRFTSASMTIGRPQRRAVSPGHLLVASMPILDPRPDAGLAKSR